MKQRAMDDQSLEGMVICSGPLLEKRTKPQPEHALKCPRCDSIHTKFCYFNNYSLSQPRYFCKTCRRYWTKGGSLRNVPVGGGCRKNKRSISKKPHDQSPVNPTPPTLPFVTYENPNDLNLSFATIRGQSSTQLGSDKHETALFGNPNSTLDILENPNSTLSFLDTIRNGFGFRGMNVNQDMSQYCASKGFNSFSSSFNSGNVDGIEGGDEGIVLQFEESKQGSCRSRDGETRVWGNDGSTADAGRDYWSRIGSWHELMNSYEPSSVSPLM